MLETLIRMYRRIPHRPRCRCRENGPSCSELGLMYAHMKGAWLFALTLLMFCESKAVVSGYGKTPRRRGVERTVTIPKGYEETIHGVKCPVCGCTPGRGHNKAAHRKAGKPI